MMVKSPAVKVNQEVTLRIPMYISQDRLVYATIRTIPKSWWLSTSSSPKGLIDFSKEYVLSLADGGFLLICAFKITIVNGRTYIKNCALALKASAWKRYMSLLLTVYLSKQVTCHTKIQRRREVQSYYVFEMMEEKLLVSRNNDFCILC